MLWILRKQVTMIPLGLCLAAIVGCGRSDHRAAVDGTVTLDGQPIDGAINFVPIDGASVSGAGGEIKAGRYSLSAAQGPIVGTHRVTIRSMRKAATMQHDPPGVMRPEKWEDVVPARYNSQSELKAEIKSGKNDVHFTLKSK